MDSALASAHILRNNTAFLSCTVSNSSNATVVLNHRRFGNHVFPLLCLFVTLCAAGNVEAAKPNGWTTCSYYGYFPYADGVYDEAIACADRWVAGGDGRDVNYFYNLNGHPWPYNGGHIMIWSCGKTSVYDAAKHECVPDAYSVIVPDETPPPQECAGTNPIDIATGIKLQREQDRPAAGKGQVELTRYYNAAQNGQGSWRFNHQQSLHVIDPHQMHSPNPANRIGASAASKTHGTREKACIEGWAEIRSHMEGSWAQGASAALSGNICQISQNGRVVRNLPIVHGRSKPPPPGLVRLIRANGTVLSYQRNGTTWVALGSDTGRFEDINNGDAQWRYTKGDITEEYAADGRLLSIAHLAGATQTLTYDSTTGLLSTVQDSAGGHLQFGYEQGRLSSVVFGDDEYHYTYNDAGMLTRVDRPDSTHRKYHYENTNFPLALTGITDERNVRYATWHYDDQGRAVSSEHASGADRNALTFNADGSTTVTNPLGKQTTYHFTYVAGARLVDTVEGHATASCQGANKGYTYTDEGRVASKTDWKGNTTTFTYNARGQEISRTEAAGTPARRVITTEWHPTLNVKTKITEPGRETIYTYDANGNITNKTTRPLAAQ